MLMGWKTLEAGLQSLTGGLTDKVVSVHGELVAGLGMTGALALYLTLGILVVLGLWRMVKLSFDVIKQNLFQLYQTHRANNHSPFPEMQKRIEEHHGCGGPPNPLWPPSAASR